jgi:hypothetical protein
MPSLPGGCSCGQIRYRITAAPIITHCCHCRLCQRQNGSAFVINSLIEAEHLPLEGSAPVRFDMPTESGRGHVINRCGTCGVALWSEYGQRGSVRFVRAATLDDPTAIVPDVHIFVRSKLPWVVIPEGAKAYEIFYEREKDLSPATLERWKAAIAKS